MVDLVITAANVIAGANASVKPGTAGEAIARGKSVYQDPTSKKMMLADSDSATAAAHDAVGVALNDAGLNQPIDYIVGGDLGLGAILTAGASYFVSNTAGGICPDADVGANEEVVLLGMATSTSNLRISIQNTGVTR